jgi:hypothetical protein
MKFVVGFFWILIVIGVLGIAFVSCPERHAQKEQSQASPQTQNSDGEIGKAKEGQGESGGWRYYKKKVEDNEKFITAASTLIIASFTIALAFATFFLWSATKDLVQDARENTEKQLRAYVGLQTMEMTLFPYAEGGFVAFSHTEARNFGQTPAYRLTIQANTTVDIPTAVPFDESQGTAKSAGAMTAFKDVGFHISQTKIITAEEAQEIRDRKKNVFFWGTIRYRDAFKKDHVFRFRLISNALLVGSTNVWSMVAHSLGFEDED